MSYLVCNFFLVSMNVWQNIHGAIHTRCIRICIFVVLIPFSENVIYFSHIRIELQIREDLLMLAGHEMEMDGGGRDGEGKKEREGERERDR